jgi:hypothetical protein
MTIEMARILAIATCIIGGGFLLWLIMGNLLPSFSLGLSKRLIAEWFGHTTAMRRF